MINKIRENIQDSDSNPEILQKMLENIKTWKNIKTRKEKIENLDSEIASAATAEDIEKEIVDTGDYNFNTDNEISKLEELLEMLNRNNSANITEMLDSSSGLDHNARTFVRTEKPAAQTEFTSISFKHSRQKLPKLTLPKFSGDIISWQAFWDSFDNAIHSNSCLSEVEKFNCLKSLLEDNALKMISGFALTNVNYQRAIALLQERFGQNHKIAQVYMHALLEIPPPAHGLKSLSSFYHEKETHIRGFEALDQSEDTYGNLLVPVILKKLPGEVSMNLSRKHGTTNWNISDLRAGILQEIDILEAGEDMQLRETVITAAFHTNSKNSVRQETFRSTPVRHPSVKCTRISTAEERVAIIKRKQQSQSR